MNGFGHRCFSWVLLLCIAVTILPLSLLHHHHDHAIHTACEESHAASEIDPCHISVFHPHESQYAACEHKSHFTNKEEVCQTCDLLNSKRHHYILAALTENAEVLFSNPEVITDATSRPYTFSNHIQGRAPPAC